MIALAVGIAVGAAAVGLVWCLHTALVAYAQAIEAGETDDDLMAIADCVHIADAEPASEIDSEALHRIHSAVMDEVGARRALRSLR